MIQQRARILHNEEMAKGFYRMRIESPGLARKIRPGQFVEVRCSEETDPLLRRPLGCHRILPDGIEMLYEIVGKGTGLLSHKRPGETVDIIGPLGNGFDIKRTTDDGQRAAILVAGGIGAAPLVALAEEIAQCSRVKVQRKNLYVLIGACKKSHILCADDFNRIGAQVLLATEDGSKGRKGPVTDILKTLRATSDDLRATIYACGPTDMLKTVACTAKTKRIPCQVSLEERMACGVGVCLGCPVRVRTAKKDLARCTMHDTQYEYKMVCKDGPVFDAEEIVW